MCCVSPKFFMLLYVMVATSFLLANRVHIKSKILCEETADKRPRISYNKTQRAHCCVDAGNQCVSFLKTLQRVKQKEEKKKTFYSNFKTLPQQTALIIVIFKTSEDLMKALMFYSVLSFNF